MSEFGSGPIVVTGATGWVGRTVVDQLAKLLPQQEFRSRLRAFSSRSGVLEYVHGMSIPTMPLSELPGLVNQEGCSSFLHAAFLTPDRCAKIGIETYTKINRSITDTIVMAVKASPSARVVDFSSGAAAYAETNQAMSSPASHRYGALKLEEEHRLQDAGTTLVLRIYALTGRFIRNPASYALGEFLLCALQNKQICVRSSVPIIRGYVNAADAVHCAIRWIFSNDTQIEAIAAVSDILALSNLAHLVSSIYNLPPPVVPELDGGRPSSYSFSPNHFGTLASTFGITPLPIKSQIVDTALGLKVLFAL